MKKPDRRKERHNAAVDQDLPFSVCISDLKPNLPFWAERGIVPLPDTVDEGCHPSVVANPMRDSLLALAMWRASSGASASVSGAVATRASGTSANDPTLLSPTVKSGSGI